MSKVPPRNRLSKKRAKPHKQKTLSPTDQQSKKKIVVFVAIAILTAIPFSMGKYFEFNSPGPYDSGGYVYSAKHILDGAKIGVDEKPSARLGTLLVNMLGVWLSGFNEIGPKLIQTILQAAALLLMFISMRKLFGTLPAAIGVIVASVYLSSPLIAKFGNVKEQYMIAFMVLGVSCFILRQLGGRWWYAMLAGALISWAPLFKPTGTTVIGAIGLFVIVQPFFKHRTWKQTGIDILLLLAGAAVAIGPLYVWIIGWDVGLTLPYKFVWKTVVKMLPAKGVTEAAGAPKAGAGYLAGSRELVPFAQQWPRVLRYYWLLILPIALAAGSIVARLLKMLSNRVAPSNLFGGPPGADRVSSIEHRVYDRFVLLLAVWWLLDMAFVWISPRSYEQYYLPLNASAAMLGGYVIALYCDKLRKSIMYKGRWIAVGVVGLACMLIMSWHIFFGIEKSPHSGVNYGRKRRGYAQKLEEISQRRKKDLRGSWEIVGEYIRYNSTPNDKIYVWGWVPGIYVKAQRFSPSAHACTMPRPTPKKLAENIAGLLDDFEQERPKFIVDTRKLHIPTNRPPYELWPTVPKGLMGAKESHFLRSKAEIAAYDKLWFEILRKNFDEDEALRYEVLRSFREFVMNNYQLAEPKLYVIRNNRIIHRMFGEHRVFQLKNATKNKELQ